MGLLLALIAAPAAAQAPATSPHPIGGVFEVGIGTADAEPLIRYWEQFGYRVGERGELTAAAARRLYGVESRLRSIRLHHQDADHGLIRIMEWERPAGDGLGMGSVKVLGSRWATTMTTDIHNLANHAEVARDAEMPVRFVSPQWAVIYRMGEGRPFFDPQVGVREMLMVQPHARQVFFQRFNYDLPLYGRVHGESFFRTSQVTHVGLMYQGDEDLSPFYGEVLGLRRMGEERVTTYEQARASRLIFDLRPGDSFAWVDYDDPRSSPTELQGAHSGRLKIYRFPGGMSVEDRRAASRPGQLGMGLYTYRVRGIEQFHRRVRASRATGVTPVAANEFGERSFSFVAPDGYFWTLVEAR